MIRNPYGHSVDFHAEIKRLKIILDKIDDELINQSQDWSYHLTADFIGRRRKIQQEIEYIQKLI